MINSLPPEVLAQVLDTLPVRIFWKDQDSRFLGCNQRFADDAGVADPQEFVGHSDFFFYEPAQAEAFRNDDADVMYHRRPKLGILEKINKMDGSVIWLETNKWPMLDADGHAVGIIGMYQDVTERKREDDQRCRACTSVAFAR
jgi:PAS domain S-box-containing protein